MKSPSILLVAGISAVAFASAAHASDLIVDEAPMAMPGVVESSGNFDGLFVGVFGGYALADLDFGGAGGLFAPDFDPEGGMLGVDVGASFTLGGNIVAGVVGDIAWANIEDSLDFGGLGGGDFSSNIDWQGSLRGRIGLDAGGFMPYLTAGLAFAHNTIETTAPAIPGPAETISDDQTHIGYTVGAGVEMAVADNITVDALYRYSDYGDATYDAGMGGGAGELGITAHQLSLGLHFGF